MDNFNQDIQNTPKRFFSVKIIFVILGIILLVEVIYAVKVLTSSPSSSSPSVPQGVVSPTVATIALDVPKTNYKFKEDIPVSVIINTGSRTVAGVDLIIKFDPKTLEATPGGLIKGAILDEYPLIYLDADKGLISISGVSNTKTGFKGQGQFAAINFKAKALGLTSLTVDFQLGSTIDSNLVEIGTSEDVLKQVSNLELVIQ